MGATKFPSTLIHIKTVIKDPLSIEVRHPISVEVIENLLDHQSYQKECTNIYKIDTLPFEI